MKFVRMSAQNFVNFPENVITSIFLFEYVPNIRLCDLIRTLKAVSSLRIRTEFRHEIRHLLWGKRFWTRSYCAISVGDGASTAIIERYIQNQNRPS